MALRLTTRDLITIGTFSAIHLDLAPPLTVALIVAGTLIAAGISAYRASGMLDRPFRRAGIA